MEPNPARNQNMIETTDALEAVSACQSMKNFLFTLILIAMVLCQLMFWMNHFGLIDKKVCSSCQDAVSPGCPKCPAQGQCPTQSKPQANASGRMLAPVFLAAITEIAEPAEAVGTEAPKDNTIEQAIDQIVESANQPQPEEDVLLERQTDTIPAEIPTEAASPEMLEPQVLPEETETAEEAGAFDKLSLFRVSWPFAKILVAICNYVILIAAVLYSLSLLICLKISLAGRLGGINHIARAFFISLFLLVVLIPWQMVLPGMLIGALWRPGALWSECWTRADSSLFWVIMLYLRFCGLWLLAVWLLLWTQIRSSKWARATLRRLGVVR